MKIYFMIDLIMLLGIINNVIFIYLVKVEIDQWSRLYIYWWDT